MRPRRFLLVTTALSSATLVAACKKEAVHEPPPGNPKGAIYDDAGPPLPPPANPKGSGYDAGLPPPKPLVDPGHATDGGASDHDGGGADAGAKQKREPRPIIPHPPANPKGSHYDDGMKKPTPVR